MYQEYHKEYSTHLEREMEFKVYGRGGKPVLVFPCQNGRFFDWEGFGMLVTLGDWLEREKIQLFCVDTIDSETLSNQRGDPCVRVRRHEAWFQYLVQELVPRIHQINPSGQDLSLIHIFQGYNATELGELFDLKPSTVRARLASARRKLKALYEAN